MFRYFILAVVLKFLVDLFLLLGTNRATGGGPNFLRFVSAAAVGAVQAGLCMLPGLSFLSNFFWRSVFVGLTCMTAFGISRKCLHAGTIFWLLQMALLGVVTDNGNIWLRLAVAGILCLLCGIFFSGRLGIKDYIPVQLCYGGKNLKLTALRDTGNSLRDPVSGTSVMVLGADAAQMLTGLTPEQLGHPVETMGAIPGLRLIPYQAIGTKSGFLLGLRLNNVRIGSWCGSQVVAFAPQPLGADGTYQALTGGML